MGIIEAIGLSKQFGRLVAVDGLSLAIEEGCILGLVGPNGAGKTTLLRMLATLLRPTCGSASIAGYDLIKDHMAIRRVVAFLPDFFNLYTDLTPRECLSFFADAYGTPRDQIPKRVERALGFVQLEQKADELSQHLSRGMVQRLGVATLLVRDAMVYLLDEPASGMDPISRIRLRDILLDLARQGKTIIISSHILADLQDFCTRIAVMDRGRLVAFQKAGQIGPDIANTGRVSIVVLDKVEAAVEVIRGFPAAQVLEVTGHHILVQLDCDLEGLARLNKDLVDNGIKVIGLQRLKSDLEDLLVKIASGQQA